MPMRPKKPRFVDGVQLVDNLYLDPRKRIGFYSYIRPDGTRKTLQTSTVEEANRLATEANEVRDDYLPPAKPVPRRHQTAYHVPIYIAYRERISPGLKLKQSWSNRCYALKQFGGEFETVGHITIEGLREWWDELTYSQQKLRGAEFRRFFNWCMSECLVPRIKFNPFTTADDLPRLLLKEKPSKKRLPLSLDDFWKIYKKAPSMGYEALQVAMDIGLYTLLREGDLCLLRLEENIQGNVLQVVVSKSLEQKGYYRAARLEWNLDEHPVLKRSINRARELSLQNRRCPFVLSHYPKRRNWKGGKEHISQVLPDRLSRMFAEVMSACEIQGTSFHEIRGLGKTLLQKQGYSLEEIRDLMAHESISTTAAYGDPDKIPFKRVSLKLEDVG